RFAFSQRRGVCIIRFPATESSIFFCFSLLRFSGEPRCPGGVFAVVPCQWWRIIGSYSGLTSEKDKNFIVRSFFRQNILNIVFSV
ncbi:hypothetical protein ACSR01_003875, partial [Escherichia coli]|nr:hypothetical protein [Escherichia coli]MED0163923.1 hypothetical protein [Escherichia coli]